MGLPRICNLPLLRNSASLRSYTTGATVSEFPDGWSAARPYKSIPGPSRWEYYRWFQPGGPLFGSDQLGIQTFLHERYGQLARLPGSLGQRDIVYTFNPEHFKTIWRTEGVWPRRPSLDTLAHYRDLRPAVFKEGASGLLSDHGERWHKLRSIVTPVVMSPKITKSNIPDVDQIAREFVERVSALRDASGEMPANFMAELDMWALESVGVAALDRRLGMLRSDRIAASVQLMVSFRDFLRIGFELESQPNLWRYFHTKKLQEMFRALDVVTDYITRIVDDAYVELQSNPPSEVAEVSLLQNLLLKGRHYAFITTYDMFLAGIDTTSSAMATLFYYLATNPEPQEKLREEVFRVLPNKDTAITTENYDQFAYFRACYKESLRFRPPVPAMVRSSGKNLILDGYRIPQMTDLFMANIFLHQSEKYFTNSNSYIPERWLRNDAVYGEELKNRNPFIYLPFGFGPRMCIGKRYAEQEIQTLTARILREYRLEWHHPPMKYASAIINSPADPLKLRMIPLCR